MRVPGAVAEESHARKAGCGSCRARSWLDRYASRGRAQRCSAERCSWSGTCHRPRRSTCAAILDEPSPEHRDTALALNLPRIPNASVEVPSSGFVGDLTPGRRATGLEAANKPTSSWVDRLSSMKPSARRKPGSRSWRAPRYVASNAARCERRWKPTPRRRSTSADG